MTVEVKGIKLNYEICGQGDDILFLHGWGASLDSFKRMIVPLSKRFRCILLDAPGCGKSELPKEALTTDDYCKITKEFMDKLGLCDPIMIGHSNGGRTILNMCANGYCSPKKIVLFGAAGIKNKKTFKQKVRQTTFKTAKRVLTLPIIKNYTEQTLEELRKHFGSADYNSAPPVMRQTLVNLINSDVSDKLHNITASTLLVWGENDTASPLWMAKVMEKEIKDCGLVVMPGLSHWNFIENPATVDAILKSFLGGK
ncbi:MAG: alpha/beta hydrolase [Clostridia bacterium]|nr:alpha/beta hydrolase [Clostridia bacterium]